MRLQGRIQAVSKQKKATARRPRTGGHRRANR